MAEPLSVTVNTYGTGEVSDERLTEVVGKVFDLSPAGIIESLDLRRPVYRDTAVYGHFGRVGENFTWEALDRVEALRQHLPRPARPKKGGR